MARKISAEKRELQHERKIADRERCENRKRARNAKGSERALAIWVSVTPQAQPALTAREELIAELERLVFA